MDNDYIWKQWKRERHSVLFGVDKHELKFTNRVHDHWREYVHGNTGWTGCMHIFHLAHKPLTWIGK